MAHSVICRHAAIVTMEVRSGDRSIIVIARRESDPYVIARRGSDVAILLLHKSPKKIVVNPRNNIYLCRFAKDLTKFIQNLYNYDQKQFI